MNPSAPRVEHQKLSLGGRLVAAVFGDRYIPSFVKLAVAVAVLGALTFVLLSSNPWSIFKLVPYRPDTDLGDRIPDKVYHFTGYFGLSLVFMWYAASRAKWLVLVLVPLMLGHAALTEVLQGYVPDRTTDWTDFVANFIGITLGTSIGLFCRRFVEREDPEVVLWVGANALPVPEPLRNSLPTRGVLHEASRPPESAEQTSMGFNRNELDESALTALQTRVLNFRFLGISCITVCVFVGSSYFVHGWQVRRNAGQLLTLAQEAREANELTKARDLYARYISLVPTNKTVTADYAMLLDQTRKGQRGAGHVFNLFEDVLRREPSREDIRRRQVKLSFEMARYTDAFAHLKVLRQSHPSEGELDVQAAECQEQLGEYAAAAAMYRLAIEHSPELVDAYQKLGLLIHLKLDQPDEASKLLDQLVTKNDQAASAWIARANFRREVGQLSGAAEDIQQAIAVAPQDLAVINAAGDLGYARAIAARSDGRAAEVERVVTETKTFLEQGLAHHLGNLDLTLRLLLLESHFGDAAAAFDDLTKIAVEHPKDPRVQMMLADVSIERGDFEKARSSIDLLPRTPQPDALRLFLRGRIETAEKNWNAALASLMEARRYMADSPTLLERADLAIARCYEALKQPEGELDAYHRILKENPTSLVGRLGLAHAFTKTGRIPEAIAEFGQLKHMPQVRLILARLLILRNLKLSELDRDWREVELLLDDARKHGDRPAEETLLRVELLAGKGLFDDARQLLENARASQSDRVEFLQALHAVADRSGDERQAALWLGQAHEAAGDPKQAETELLRAVELGGTDPAARQTLMQFYLRQRRPDDAIKVFQTVAHRLDRRELAKSYAVFGDLGRSVSLLQAELKDRPDEPSALQALADIYLSNGQETRAEPLLRRIIAQLGKVPASTVKRARRQLSVLLSTRSDEAAQTEARALLTANIGEERATPEDARAKAAMLAASRQLDDRNEALRLLEKLDDQGLLQSNDRWLLARLYDDTGNAPQAARHLERLLATGSGSAAYLRDYVRYQITHRSLDAASVWLKRLTELAPQDLQTSILTARWQAARGEHSAARDTLEAAAKAAIETQRVTPFTELANASDAIARTLDEPKQVAEYQRTSERLHQAALVLEPAYVQVWVNWLAQHNRVSDAFGQLDNVWKHLPPEAAAGLTLSLLGSTDDAKSRFAEVERRLSGAIEKQPKSTLLKVCLADLRSLQGRSDDAESLYRTVLASDRNNVSALNNLAWNLALRAKLTDDALEFINRAISLAGPAPQLLDTRACVYIAQHNPSKALNDLKAALSQDESSSVLFHLAIAHSESGDTAQAQAAFASVQKLGFKPQHPLERDQHAALVKKLTADTRN